jgi:hypothetical protein
MFALSACARSHWHSGCMMLGGTVPRASHHVIEVAGPLGAEPGEDVSPVVPIQLMYRSSSRLACLPWSPSRHFQHLDLQPGCCYSASHVRICICVTTFACHCRRCFRHCNLFALT